MKSVYCENCLHYKACMDKRKAAGISDFVEGMVNCDRYEERNRK